MTLRYLGLFGLLVLGLAFISVGAHAGDKKDPKKEEFKDIVVDDALTTADMKDKVRTSCYCKPYVLKMVEGKTYQIDMTSGAFDSYLRLENAAGQEVASDDDGGGFPSARIIYRAPKTGDYTIIATTFGGGSTGKFRVTVKEVR